MWLSVCAHGDAGVCGCGAHAQCVHCLLLRGPAPPQQQPAEEGKETVWVTASSSTDIRRVYRNMLMRVGRLQVDKETKKLAELQNWVVSL